MTKPEERVLISTSYDRPTRAWLVVRLENGDEWEARPADLDKFRLIERNDAYRLVAQALEASGMTDPGGRHSSLRYLIERTLAYTDMAMDPDNEEDFPVIENVRENLARWEDRDADE